MYKRLRSQRSDFNGTFDLLKVPLQLRWSNADSILEPTKGATIQLRVIPSFQIFKPQFAYCINTLTGSFYQSLTKDKRHVFAAKLTLGSIVGANQHEIPPPERFYAGSESTLRGYRYLTVSPLSHHHHHKPLGGRSMIIGTLELRNRIGENLGLVFFYDVGNVFKYAYPNFREGIRQSTGLGLRYYTPIGPVRLDIAFPLNKRHIDNSFEAYFSIGQSF
jgi:translocation and assembly module TamA